MEQEGDIRIDRYTQRIADNAQEILRKHIKENAAAASVPIPDNPEPQEGTETEGEGVGAM